VVPKGADIMIAGSSCIDYSLLNNKPKEFGASGESYDTLKATLDYAKVHKPLVVILENVLSFPWHNVEQWWQEAGYVTQVAFLDSKDFYLPQTRQRGYMIGLRWKARTESQVGLEADNIVDDAADDAADNAAKEAALIAVKKWFEVLGNLQRRASSPFTEFILADDDTELRKYSQQAAAMIMTNKNVSWEKCRIECLSCRSGNFLGFKKPVTDWENNGSCVVPDFYDKEWYKKQVERVWDTLDINHLRSILRFYDFSYKS
jgi:site-specific DNA-cytosine methylase